ncbi:hypothetical protein [Actinoplanes friuliensis]|uniref:Uncharacterized protein n=1 Tax=Actinoplanes friuliensis DSM 7358 TaxID=1246995 RepID=U5VVM1_9ACTN|nr:hypothetical protein [Actinoplanes friuliensis]AGZ39760.1 hypothetical protein AFR_07355 [Actinoplanes friuliensis DSM 7358]
MPHVDGQVDQAVPDLRITVMAEVPIRLILDSPGINGDWPGRVAGRRFPVGVTVRMKVHGRGHSAQHAGRDPLEYFSRSVRT